jgi:hypothetical protein
MRPTSPILSPRLLATLLFSCGVAVAVSCSTPKRDFGDSAGDAGDSSSNGGDATAGRSSGGSGKGGGSVAGGGKSSGTAGSSNTDAGAAGETSTGGVVGTGGTNAAAGTSGTAGGAGAPACGAPGGKCCAGDVCVSGASCTANACACGAKLTACSDSCVDLSGDGKNCGVCGHSCLGGVCDLGSCQPVPVTSGQSRLYKMTTDGNYLYWSGSDTAGSGHYVARRAVDGSGTVKVIAPTEAGVSDLALSGDSLYWIAAGHLRTCAIPDCPAGPVDKIATVGNTNCGSGLLYASDKSLLFFSCGSDYNAKTGSFFDVSLTTQLPAAVGSNPSNPGDIVRDDANIYWINSSTYTMDQQNLDGGIFRYRLSDGAVTSLVSGLRGDISPLAISGSALFFSGNIQVPGTLPVVVTTAILRAPLPNGLGSGSLPQFAPATRVTGMEGDASHLYFSDLGTVKGSINRCPNDACPTPEVIVPGLDSPMLGTQDAVSIYWSTTAPGATVATIQRLAK